MTLDRVVQYLLDEPAVDHARSPKDTMFTGDEAHYRGSGMSALRNVRTALAIAGRSDARRILDLPCGFGRATRYLRADFPDAEICACDLDPEAVDYCAETFGAIPSYSSTEIGQIRLPGTFDLIWCGSLFTHLPAARWGEFFDFFDSVLDPGGLLLFTVHGRMSENFLGNGYTFGMGDAAATTTLATLQRDGFAYWEYPPEVGFDAGYGVSFSRPGWVVEQLTTREHMRLLSYSEAGWFRHQDVVVCWKPPLGWTSEPPSATDPRHS